MSTFLFSSLLCASLAVVGCSAKQQVAPGNNAATGTTSNAPKIKVAIVTDTGGINDNSFNQAAWEGATRLKKDLGFTVQYAESKQKEDYAPNINGFVKDKWDLTWGIGFLMADDLAKIATENPQAKLAIIDSNLNGKIPPNVTAVTFKEEEGSFLMGVIAGKMTKSNKIGFIGGVEFPLIQKFEYGFKAGVKTVNPAADISVAYAGDFNAADKGKVFANTMYGKGVDVIYHAAGATGNGVFAEAKERGKGFWVIGVDRDQSSLAPDNTLSSMVKRVDNAVYSISKDLSNGVWNGGKEVQLGLKEDGVNYAPTTSKNTPADVISLVDDFKKKIIAGQIAVPKTKAEFDTYVTGLKK